MDDSELLARYASDRSEDAFAELARRHLILCILRLFVSWQGAIISRRT
jgi:hypothetical protein